ncbi:MAG: fluoride efflux transporter CrcB [Longimicrobiales bacterium]|nr:fluoride efflux transporter CrcB [Longimicrobiales bacterium]
MSPATLAAVAVGGAVGALGRFGLASWVQHTLGAGFPWGTLAVNLTGSFLMGSLAGALQRGLLPPEAQVLAAVGILGSFTTFSAFSLENVRLLQEGAWGRALVYMAASVGVGLMAALAGLALAGVRTGR